MALSGKLKWKVKVEVEEKVGKVEKVKKVVREKLKREEVRSSGRSRGRR